MATWAIRFLLLSAVLLTASTALGVGQKTTSKRGNKMSTAVSTEEPVTEGVRWSELNPGIIQTNDAKYLTLLHEEKITDGLSGRLENASVPPLNGSIPLILFKQRLVYRINDIKVVDPGKLQVKVKVNLTDGHVLQVDLPEVTIEGKYSFVHETTLWKTDNMTGNFTLLLDGVTVRCNRRMTISNKSREVLRIESTNCSIFIDHFEFLLRNPNATTLMTMTELPVVKQHIIDFLQKAVNRFTDLEIDYGHDHSKDTYIDMTLLSIPNIIKRRLVLRHRGEIRFRNETSDHRNLVKSLVPSGQASVEYSVSQYPIDTYCEIVHRHKLLDCNFSQDDLPANRKRLLSTEDVENGFGRLFPQAPNKFPNMSVEIEAQTSKKPFVTINRTALHMTFDFKIAVFAKVTSSSKKPIFTAHVTMTYNVSLSVTKGKIVSRFSPAKKQEITVVESNIGPLNSENVLILANQVFVKNMRPFFGTWATEGIQLTPSKTLREIYSQWKIVDDRPESLLLRLEYERRRPQKKE